MKIDILHAGACTAPEHLAITGGERRTIHFPAMFALLRHARLGAMLFDTGYSQRFFEETRRLPRRIMRWTTPVTLREEDLLVNQLAQFDLRPQDIRQVFISHFHADHIGALRDLPQARFVYLPHAYQHLRGLKPAQEMRYAFLGGLIPNDFDARSTEVDIRKPLQLGQAYAPFETGYDLLGDESLVAVELPGHARGQMGLFVRDAQERLFFLVADAAWLMEAIRTKRPPRRIANLLFSDPAEYRQTLDRLHEYHLTHPQTIVIPSHCEQTIRRWETARAGHD